MQNIIAGNWKLKGTKELAVAYSDWFVRHPPDHCQVIVCPTFDLLPEIRPLEACPGVSIGVQDFTHSDAIDNRGLGDPNGLPKLGVRYVILGHSDRRNKCHETSSLVARKVNIARHKGLVPIVCIGEKKEERTAGLTIEVVQQQICESIDLSTSPESFILAYEPVWAIGTGVTPTSEDIQSVHAFIRSLLISKLGMKIGHQIPVMYGGSADSTNAERILGIENVNGLLVGGASLDIHSFRAIIQQAGA